VLFPLSLEFDNLRLSNPNIGVHHLCARENTHEMLPKKRLKKELPAEGTFEATKAQVLKTTQTTTQPQTSTEPQQATAEVRRPEEPPQQPPSQAEVLAMNTSVPTTQHQSQQQDIKAQEDPQQDSKRRSKQSSRMSWHAFTKKMSTCDSCRSGWPEERQWPREPRLCSNRSNKKERPRQSCNEQ
jgi:hypothetical protein